MVQEWFLLSLPDVPFLGGILKLLLKEISTGNLCTGLSEKIKNKNVWIIRCQSDIGWQADSAFGGLPLYWHYKTINHMIEFNEKTNNYIYSN